MKRHSRRDFLSRSGAGLAGLAGTARAGVEMQTAPSADLIAENGPVLTMDPRKPVAGSLAVRGGRILAVGHPADIRRHRAGHTETLDLAGRSVTPGLIDAHSHVVGFGQMQLKFVLLRPPEVDSFHSLGEVLARAARDKPHGEWIIGRGFDTFREGRFPRRRELDEAVPHHPVLIIHWGGQFGVANTAALERAGLLRDDAEDPYGGRYLRDRRGMPDGVLLHYPAIYSVYQPTLDPAEQLECAAWGMARFAENGVTCIHDNFCHPRYAAAYIRLERMGRLPCRVRVYPYVKNLKACRQLVRQVQRYDGPLVRLQGIKLAVDGYALLYDVPQEHRHLALPMHPQPLFNQIVETIHRAGLQADVHAVGDKGVDWTLAAYAAVTGSATVCRERRHRIEHFPFRKLDSIRRAAEWGVPVCLQPNYIEIKADDFRDKLGSKMASTLLPIRTFLQEDVHLAFGADVPAFPSHRPMDGIRSALERKTGSGRRLSGTEAVDFLEAVRIHTLDSAYAAFDEQDLGSLAPGKQADFVIWDCDLRRVRTGAEAAALAPVATYLAGKAVYRAG